MPMFSDEYFMEQALVLAQQGAVLGEIPVGALVVCQHKIIGKGYNQTEQLNDVTAHAEILAITAATGYLGAKYLKDCTLYVTIEPCVMCAGAIFWSQLNRLVYGASEPKRGFSRISSPLLHPKTHVTTGILKQDCEQVMQDFFKNLRT